MVRHDSKGRAYSFLQTIPGNFRSRATSSMESTLQLEHLKLNNLLCVRVVLVCFCMLQVFGPQIEMRKTIFSDILSVNGYVSILEKSRGAQKVASLLVVAPLEF